MSGPAIGISYPGIAVKTFSKSMLSSRKIWRDSGPRAFGGLHRRPKWHVIGRRADGLVFGRESCGRPEPSLLFLHRAITD